MRLYMFPVAPNPTKVRLYLAEKRAAGCPIELEEVTVNLPKGEQNDEGFIQINPMGALPVLETDAGTVIHESLPIIEYFEDLHPVPSLWGADPEARAIGRQLERIADLGILMPVARRIHATNSPLGLPPDPVLAAYHEKAAVRNFEYMERILADERPFLAGDRPTVADCTLAAALQFARFRELSVLDPYPRLTAWDARYREREPARSVLVL